MGYAEHKVGIRWTSIWDEIDNHITRPGATCNLPHTWRVVLAFYMQYIGMLYEFIDIIFSLQALCNAC